MTRTILGPDGEQQRVTIERDFKNESELNNFLKQFGDNLNKKNTSKPSSSRKSPSDYRTNKTRSYNDTTNDFKKPPGYKR